MRYYPYGKRALDLLLCLLALPMALPLVGVIAFISAIVLRQQVFYSHYRPGYQGKPFVFYKFSTLLPEEHRNGIPLNEGERQTSWGKFLRDYSLDELPQLYNILKGDMSWVGPRPLLMEYLPLYSPQEARRHLVKPGLTGLAQIKGRNELSWPQKMHFDQVYVSNICLKSDLKILFDTFWSVLGGQRINFGQRPQPIHQQEPQQPAITAAKAAQASGSYTTDKAF